MSARPAWLPPDWDSWRREEQDRYLRHVAGGMAPLRLRYCPLAPTPKQEAFIRTRDLEAFFGGSAGPGKSTALLMAALQYADVPGYAALILRRTYGELSMPGALMSMAREWLEDSGAAWAGQTHTWTFPSKATLSFGYLQHEGQERRYKSSEYQFCGFDELTEFDERQYEYLFSRLRGPSTGPLSGVPLRMRSASNPGGPGHDWVMQRFVAPGSRRRGAVFVPARIEDNPHLDSVEYERSLNMLTGAERLRLLAGDWDAEDAGSLFPSTIWTPEDWPPATSSVRAWDLAATRPSEQNPDPDWTVGLRLSQLADGRRVVTDVARFRDGPGEVKRRVVEAAARDGRGVPVWVEQEGGSAGKSIVSEYAAALPGFEVHGLHPTGDKQTRARPAAAAIESGALGLSAWLSELQAVRHELRRFPGGAHDDVVDALSLAYEALNASPPRGASVPDLRQVRIPIAVGAR